METVQTLIVGAGVSGLATAAALGSNASYLVLEADRAVGGYCKTIVRDGFVWDYSGHFFHFKHPEIERWLRARMGNQRIRVVDKRAFVAYGDRLIDFPFQKNIHQLPRDEFIECLHDLFFAHQEGTSEHGNFKAMLYGRFGRAIADKFLIPYNEKLYACDLAELDRDAMGRFFPHASLPEIVRNMRHPDNASYNQTFTYPEGGAIQYIEALASEVPKERIALQEPLLQLDLGRKVAVTPKREIGFSRVISSAPFPKLLRSAGVEHDPSVFSANRVLVFNLGFDKKGPREAHWIYYPSRELVFYRVGFYDNIWDSERMSLYVEIGLPAQGPASGAVDVPALRTRVLADLKKAGVITDQKLVAEHHVLMDPAYVHITKRSIAEQQRLASVLAAAGVHSIGRYGGWTYCSIEDNIVQARALVEREGSV